MATTESAYDRGYRAGREGLDLTDNPYPKYPDEFHLYPSDEWEQWREGWMAHHDDVAE